MVKGSGGGAFLVRYWAAPKQPTYCLFVGGQVPLPARAEFEKMEQGRPYDVAAVRPYVGARWARKLADGAWTRIAVLYVPIFKDDRRDVALRKIVHELEGRGLVSQKVKAAPRLLPIAWRKAAPLLFSTASRALPANPFDATEIAVAALAPTAPVRTSLENEWIGDGALDLTFLHHLPAAFATRPALDHYVFREDWNIGSMKQIVKDDAMLARLWAGAATGAAAARDAPAKLLQAEWGGVCTRPVALGQLFGRLHTSDAVPLIQWIDDRQHVLYKLRKTHPYAVDELAALTDYQRLSKTSVLVLHFGRGAVRVAVNAAGEVAARARPAIVGRDAGDAYVSETARHIAATLASAAGMRVAVAPTSLTGKVHLKTPLAMDALTRHLSRYTSLMQVRKAAAGNGLYVQWLRASNYRQNVDIVEVVKHRVQLGVDAQAIVDDLVEINGYSLADARAIVEASDGSGAAMVQAGPSAVAGPSKASANPAFKAFQTIVSLGMMLHLVPVKGMERGIDCHYMNAASHDDVDLCLRWLTAVLAEAGGLAADTPGPTKEPVADEPGPSAPPKPEVILEKDPFALSSSASSSSSSGGAGLNFIKDLQRADPDVFNKNYTKKCQSASNSQPMVLTRAEFDALPAEARAALDNHIAFGSNPDPAKHHVYFCPAVWCAKSKTPMSHDQYVANGNKCADGSEGAMVWDNDYWGHNPRGKRYIGFTSKSVEAATPCLPCCYVHPPKKPAVDKCLAKATGQPVPEEGSKKKAKAVAKEPKPKEAQKDVPEPPEPPKEEPKEPPAGQETYLLTHQAPLPSDRWGIIPQTLHVALHRPDLPHNQCKTQYSTKPCIVRRGILHHSDSLMQAIGYVVLGDVNSKGVLLAKIKEAVSADVFVTMAGGRVLQAFAPAAAIVPERVPGLRREWAAWLATQKRYAALFPGAAGATGLRLSRELAIYTAYKRFFQYLASTEDKDVDLLVAVVRALGVELVIWEKDADDLVHLRCPLTGAAVPQRPTYAMLLQDNGYFEPLEIKMRGKPGHTLHAQAPAPALLQKCTGRATHDAFAEWREAVRLTRELAATTLAAPAAFLWDRAVVSPDWDVVGLMTAGNLYVDVGRVPLDEAARLDGLTFVFAEDVADRTWRVRVGADDIQVFSNVLGTWGIDVFGLERAQANAAGQVEYIYAVPPAALAGVPAVPTSTENALTAHERQAAADRQRRASAQWMVGKALVRHYDAWVGQPADGAARDAIVAHFPAVVHDVVSDILQEIPIGSKKDVEAWLSHVYTAALPFLSPNVQESRRYAEVMFSQVAVERGLLVRPAKAPVPKADVLLSPTVQGSSWKALVGTRKWPAFLPGPGAAGFERQALPWKWADTRKYSWREYTVWHKDAGTVPTVPAFWEWLAARCHVPLTWKMVTLAYMTFVGNTVFAQEALTAEYLGQPGALEAFRAAAGWPGTLTKANAAKRLSAMAAEARLDLLEKAVAAARPHDLLWYFAAKLAGVTVLIVSNVDYTREDHLAGIECVDYKPVRDAAGAEGAGEADDEADDEAVVPDQPVPKCHIKKKRDAGPAKVPRGSVMDLLTNTVLLAGGEELAYTRPFVFVYKHVKRVDGIARETYCPIEVAPGAFYFDQLRDAPFDLQNVACCLWAHRAHRRERATLERLFNGVAPPSGAGLRHGN